MRGKSTFDREYESRPGLFGAKPTWGLEKHLHTARLEPGQKALDIGCGQGRDALYLASRGFDVDAFDISAEAIRSLKRVAEEQRHMLINAKRADVRELSLPTSGYAVVVARTILDHLDRVSVPAVIDMLKNACWPGGAVFATVFTVDDPGHCKGIDKSSEFASQILHYFKRGELLGYFDDFELRAYEEVVKADNSHGPAHNHGKARIVAIRPK
ncbi:MAG: methyltransferase domain-containing protein [Candidatus Eisenbacteria sp.]|nr:methyltransferase domain-containing protein [Candidatus Eisenbacteria bacterium]